MIHFLELHGIPILEQLQLEEALLKVDERQWCILNHGASPAIVMGISGKPEKVLDLDKFRQHPVPLIRRFSGGGTVYVDRSTLFVTFICDAAATKVLPKQKSILEWMEKFYRPVFGKDFVVHENDYAFCDRKFGGNAFYLRKERWLHHTSFLWDYDSKKMEYLTLPEKAPKYRQGRNHADFLCSLSERFEDPSQVIQSFKRELSNTFEVKTVKLADVEEIGKTHHHKSTLSLLCGGRKDAAKEE